ncbi:MAG: hypothetical protein ACNYPF_04070 [Candidatus Puniceispirillales bacterium WSBS_2018_MAG_OTU23]
MPDRNEDLTASIELSTQLAQQVHELHHRANPFLNILNSTSKSVAQYPDLIGSKSWLWRLAHSVAGAGFTLLRAIRYWPNAILLNREYAPADVMIISHLTSASHLANHDDFYVGKMAQNLEDAGYKTTTILINHCGANAVDANTSKRSNTVILPAFKSPFAEFNRIFRMLWASITLPKLDHAVRFSRLARLAQFSSGAIDNLRIGEMLKRIIARARPKAILYTFEGHGWERFMAAFAHQHYPKTHLMGYQHAVMFPGAKAVDNKHGGGADPNHIFTVGNITKDMLVNSSDYDKEMFSVLGSIKSLAVTATAFDVTGACLIAPEGTLGEVMLMGSLAIEAARAMPEQAFILRLHPVLNRDIVARELAKTPFPTNFKLSDAPLEADLTASSWLCYRGSSVAIQGILSGLRPIYLNPDDSVANNDPIPDNIAFRRVADSASTLTAIITADLATPAIGQGELTPALKFAHDYVMPFAPDVLIKHLEKLIK